MTETDSPSPYEIRRGDALALLRDLPDASVDAVITDPPYSSGGFTRGDRMGDTGAKYVQSDSGNQSLANFAGDNRDQRGYAFWVALWLGECLRVVRPGGTALMFTDWRQLPITTDVVQAAGWVWRGIVPWYKPVARPQVGRFTAQCEYVIWASNGAMPSPGVGGHVLPGFYQGSPPRDRDHQTQKPVEVMRQLVKIVPEGGVVLDPFAGSGTTGVAALMEGRRFLGFEITEHYAKVAEERCAEVADGTSRTSPNQGVLL